MKGIDKMKVKISNSVHGGTWYARRYLEGRTCEVLAINKNDGEYMVLHPVTKKAGYWISFAHCRVIEYKPQAPTWEDFLKNNIYGYSR